MTETELLRRCIVLRKLLAVSQQARADMEDELRDLRRKLAEQSRNWAGTEADLAELRIRRLVDGAAKYP